MPYSQDPNLPCGCTNADLDRHMGGDDGEEDCETCNGTGIITEAGEEDCRCNDCEGKGVIRFSISDRRQAAREEAAIDRYEDDREDRLVGRD